MSNFSVVFIRSLGMFFTFGEWEVDNNRQTAKRFEDICHKKYSYSALLKVAPLSVITRTGIKEGKHSLTHFINLSMRARR